MDSFDDPASPRKSHLIVGTVAGAGFGGLVEVVAIFLAIISAGTGHGDYIVARALFPVPLLFMPVEGGMGVITLSLGVVQFPFYGGFLVWSFMRRAYHHVALLVLLHLAATVICFTGWLSQFV